MATKIRRSLFIGLGGTGMKALLHTKKMFIDTYGEVPPMIGFLGIDTDSTEYNKCLKSAKGDDVRLTANEQCSIYVENDPKPTFNRNRAKLSWLPDENVFALKAMTVGAGQVRSNGRFAFTVNRDKVAAVVQDKLDAILSAHIIDNPKYELLSQSAPEIHMAFSICGGTGSGTFINMAYLLRQVAQGCKICGYAVMPAVFHSMMNQSMERVSPNAYGALVDLDYLMSHTWTDTHLKLEYLSENQNVVIDDTPFDSVVLIDNKNANKDTYKDVSELAEMVSLAFVTASGDLGVSSVLDNFTVNMTQGTMDVENKRAWAGGMGACEIIYRGEVLAEIYRMKAAQHLIDRLTNSVADADVIANAWIDTPEVKIRENNNHDDVIDFIADENPQIPFNLNDKETIRAEVDTNKSSNKLKQANISAKIDELVTRVRGELRKLIVAHINSEGGVALSKNILNTIKAQIDICQGQMVEEKEGFENSIPAISSNIDALISEIEKSWWGQKEARARLSDAMCTYNTTIRNIQRRNAAITVYNSILVMISDTLTKVENIEKLLNGAKTSLTGKISKIQTGATNNNCTFQINLAAEEAKRISVNSAEVIISDFVKTLGGEFKLYGLDDFSSNEVENMLLGYTSTLAGANAYASKGVEDVLGEMIERGESGIEELKRNIKMAIGKSMPLFRFDHDGWIPEAQPGDFFYVGVCDKSGSVLNDENEHFKNELQGSNVQFVSIGMADRIIIYRQVGVVPVYAVVGIDQMRGKYKACKVNCHIDANIQARMEREEFSIDPVAENNNDMLDLWVKGFIYGLIKNESGCYYMKSESLGDFLGDYWVKLAPWRDEAYEEFKRHETDVVKDFNAHITAENARIGEEQRLRLMADAKNNYLDGYSQLRITRQTLGSHGYERVARLVEQEGRHLKNL